MDDNTIIDRIQAKKALALYLNIEKNINILEKRVFEKSNNDPITYRLFIYQVCYNLKNDIILSRKNKVKNTLDMIKQDKLGFNHSEFDNERILQEEYDEYLVNPFEVVKGLMKCPKCKSDKTISYSKNDRSSDEPLSVYATCFICKHNWRENN